MGKTPGEEEEAKVHTEENEDVKRTLNYLTLTLLS